MLDQGIADVGLFVLLAPERNHLVQEASGAYANYLRGPRQGRAHYLNLSLERLVEAYAAVKHETFARMLHRRYLDLWQIDGELALDDPPAGPGAVGTELAAQSIAA
jgi:hypothetical protein